MSKQNFLYSDPREKYYKRNYITLMFEAFFFSFSISIFSYTTVLPVYVSSLSSKSIWISLIAVSYFGISNLFSVFSCILGVNAKSAKWLSVTICLLQRVGQLLIYLSTYAITGSASTALTVFFISYILYTMTAGMSSPVFSNMVSAVIHRNVSGFYGSYSLAGAVSGVLGAQLVRVLMETYNFPHNYRYMFLSGLVMALIATVVVIIGLKEIPQEEEKEKIGLRDLWPIFKSSLKENIHFRSYMIIRGFSAAAEMTMPFYIIKISSFDGVPAGFVGTMTTILLVSNLVFSKLLGYVGDKKGPFYLLRISCAAGILASAIAVFANTPQWGYLLFVLVSLSSSALQLATFVSVITYSKKGMVSVYSTLNSLLIAPIYSLFSLGGGAVANSVGISPLFYVSMIIYVAAFMLSFSFIKKYKIR